MIRLASLLCVLALADGSACAQKPAQAKEQPAMTLLEAAQLDAALGHMRDAQRAAKEAEEVFLRHQKRAQEILARYDLKLIDLGKTAGIDFESGRITRAPKPDGAK